MLTNWLTVAFLVNIMMLIKFFYSLPPTRLVLLPPSTHLLKSMWACVILIISWMTPVNSTGKLWHPWGCNIVFFLSATHTWNEKMLWILLLYVSYPKNYIYFCCLLTHSIFFYISTFSCVRGCKSTCMSTQTETAAKWRIYGFKSV